MRSLDNQILKLLSNNDVTFFIPPYQRNPKNLGAKKLVEEFKAEKKNSLDDLKNRFK